jgi:hypothetical protein
VPTWTNGKRGDDVVVQVPDSAVGGSDIQQPLTALLEGIGLLASSEDMKDAGRFAAVFTGPPQSVAVIEAGATALSKWWAAGLGASVVATWGAVVAWWGDQPISTRNVVLWAAALASSAAILAIGYIIASDVRGRAAASVATINGRANLADSMIRAAQLAYAPKPPSPNGHVIALPTPLAVRYTSVRADDETGWVAIALRSDGEDETNFLIVKDSRHAWVGPDDLEFF